MLRWRTIDLPYPPEFMTAEVLARHLSVEPDTIDRWTAAGILPQPIKPKGVRLWRWSKVVAALDPSPESMAQSASFDPSVEAARHAAAERKRNGRAA